VVAVTRAAGFSLFGFMFVVHGTVGGHPLYAFPVGDSALASDLLSL